jgi:uncharacterized membrane protein
MGLKSYNKNTLVKKFIMSIVAIFMVIITPFVLNPVSESANQEIRDSRRDMQGSVQGEFFIGRIKEVILEYEDENPLSGSVSLRQEVEVGVYPENENILSIYFSDAPTSRNLSTDVTLGSGYNEGDLVILNREEDGSIFLIDKYRLDKIFFVGLIFLILVVLMTGFKGFSSFMSLLFSIIVLVQFLIPQLVVGENLVFTTFITGIIVGIVTMYLSHGISRQTTIAITGFSVTILVAVFLSVVVVDLSGLSGFSSEDIIFLRNNQVTQEIDLKSLLLAGIIIGTLGVLDDVTTAQATTVSEIIKANPSLGVKEVFTRGMHVGQEHVVSMVNTLAMAYAGVSLPFLLLLSVNNMSPGWVMVNSEVISEEIVRALVGSIALVLAVPLTTILAAYFLRIRNNGRIYEKI